MKKILSLAFSAFLLGQLAQSSAQANDFTSPEALENTQIGVGIAAVDMNLNSSGALYYLSVQKDLEMMMGDFDSFALFRLGKSTAAKKGNLEANFDFLLSGLLKNSIQLQNGVNVYGLAGFTVAKISEKVLTASSSVTDLSFTYGFGATYEFFPNLNFGLEYAQYSMRATAFSLNTAYKF